jgi:hypothetical protein
MEAIAEDYYYYIPESQALVELTGNRADTLYGSQQTFGSYSASSATGMPLHVPWGSNNLAPQEMLRLSSDNPIKMQLIKISRNLLLGNRLMLLNRVLKADKNGNKVFMYEPVDNYEVEDYLDMLDMTTFFRKSAYNLEVGGNVFANLSINRQSKVSGIHCFDVTEARCEVANFKTGRIENYHINPDWEIGKKEDTVRVAAFDKMNPARYAESIMHGRDWTPGQFYYDHPAWWGTKAWTEVANKIALFHQKGLENGYSIKYHIKVPKKMFEKGDDAKNRAAEQKFNREISAFLNDPNRKEKTFVSTFNTDQETGKAMPGIEIIELNNQMSDDAYTKLLQSATEQQTAGHGLPPQISNISSGGRFGASGSELRSALQVYLAVNASVGRDILLQPLYAIKKIMGWDRNLFFGFEDKIITTLDDSKTGQKTQNDLQNNQNNAA